MCTFFSVKIKVKLITSVWEIKNVHKKMYTSFFSSCMGDFFHPAIKREILSTLSKMSCRRFCHIFCVPLWFWRDFITCSYSADFQVKVSSNTCFEHVTITSCYLCSYQPGTSCPDTPCWHFLPTASLKTTCLPVIRSALPKYANTEVSQHRL